MPASPLQKFVDNQKINPDSERLIQCPYCPQQIFARFGMTENGTFVKDFDL